MQSVKKHISELVHHFIFTYWAFVWGYAITLSSFIWIFLNKPFRYDPVFDFFSYQNNPLTVRNLFTLEILFICFAFVTAYLCRERLSKIDALLAFFSLLILISMTILFWPILIGVLVAPKAS